MAIEPPTPIAMATIASRLLNQLTALVNRLAPNIFVIGEPTSVGQPLRKLKYAIVSPVRA